MTDVQKALLVGAIVMGIALLAVAGIVPEKVAQWAPFAALAVFPSFWMGRTRKCQGEEA